MTQDAPEIWLPIPGYEGLYEVSNMGVIRSIAHQVVATYKHKTGVMKIRARVMRTRIHKKYLSISLTKDGVQKHTTVHQCVARAFVPNPLGLPEVDHKDTNKLNNRSDNLEWVTQEENMRRAMAAGLITPKKIRPPRKIRRGEEIHCAKLREFQVREILMATGLNREIAARYGVTTPTIQQIRSGKKWKHVKVEPIQPELFQTVTA